MGNDIHIDAKAYAGTSIERACAQLCRVADRINCNLHCDFNGVTLIVRPGDDAERLARAWEVELKSGHSYKVTTADRAPPLGEGRLDGDQHDR